MRNLVAACVILVSASAVWAQLGEHLRFTCQSGMIKESLEIKHFIWIQYMSKNVIRKKY